MEKLPTLFRSMKHPIETANPELCSQELEVNSTMGSRLHHETVL